MQKKEEQKRGKQMSNNTPSYGQLKASWNRTVNRIREHYGMDLFDVDEPDLTDRTCKDCVHYKVCKYKADCVPICEDYLD